MFCDSKTDKDSRKEIDREISMTSRSLRIQQSLKSNQTEALSRKYIHLTTVNFFNFVSLYLLRVL